MYLFISDLHLEASRPELLNAFLTFLSKDAAAARRLYILGDLFEAWIGDDDNAPLAASVKSALLELTVGGVEVAVQHGNRDFLLGTDFAAQTGCRVMAEQETVDLFGRKALLMHGDSLCTRDSAYMEWRKTARDPEWQAGILGVELEQRRQLVAGLRQQSVEANSNKAEDIMDVTPEEVVRVMTEANVDWLIHGHTHRPAVHRFETQGRPARRVVLGDWDDSLWFLKASEGGLELTRRLLD